MIVDGARSRRTELPWGRTDGRNRTRAGGRIDGGREEREIVEVMIIMLTPPAARSPASAFAIRRRKSRTDRPPDMEWHGWCKKGHVCLNRHQN